MLKIMAATLSFLLCSTALVRPFLGGLERTSTSVSEPPSGLACPAAHLRFSIEPAQLAS